MKGLKAIWRWFWRWPWSVKLGTAAAIVLVVFAFFNDSTTTIHLLFGQVDMPTYVALGVASVLGGIVGVVLGHALARREEREEVGADERSSAPSPAEPVVSGDATGGTDRDAS